MNRAAWMVRLVIFAGLPLCEAAAWQPNGGLEELFDTSLLPRLRPGVVMRSFSSYDRTGGNNDGFSGRFSKLRTEDGNSVIAEMNGPGCIYRIWFTHSVHDAPGLLERKGEHIRIYLNGSPQPALDVPLERIFDGSLPRFPSPISGEGIGGFYSYIPIPYRESCKVVVDGEAVRFYQINYATFPSDEGVKDFHMGLSAEEQRALDRAVAFWKDPLGDLIKTAGQKHAAAVNFDPARDRACSARGKVEKPSLIQGISLAGVSPEELDSTQIEILSEDDGITSIRLPLSLYLGQYFRPEPFSSLLFGEKGGVYYNRVPVVCSGAWAVRFYGEAPFNAELTVYTTPLSAPAGEMARLDVQVSQSLPTRLGVLHPLLVRKGRGHYVGTYLVTEGPKGLPYWLEGDDIWTVDGEMTIHGTGSEDYFNCGWYALKGRLNGPAAKPSHGFPIYNETDTTMRAAAFRWHLTDPVPFDNDIDAGIEHGGRNEKIADYRSAAFYYIAK